MGRLQDRAEHFAAELTELVNATVTTGCAFHATLVDGVAFIRPPGKVLETNPLVPLSTTSPGDARLWLRVRFTAALDSEGEHLAIQTSVLGLCIDERMQGPLRIEYDRDKVGKQAAHLQLEGESSQLGYAYAIAGRSNRPLRKLHIPLGDRRFRPTLEDFIEFLIQEELITDLHHGWQNALNESRRGWLTRQTQAAVRREPAAAVEQLEAMGYEVSLPPAGSSG